MLEAGLASAIPVAIGFLANQVGLGNVPEKIVEIIGGLRELVDQALDWLIDQAVRLGQAALTALGVGGEEQPAAAAGAPGAGPVHEFEMNGHRHRLTITRQGAGLHVVMASTPGDLLAKATKARDEQRGPNGDQRAAAELDTFLGQYSEPLQALETADPASAEEHHALLVQMAADLVRIAERYRLTDLTLGSLGFHAEAVRRVVYAALTRARRDLLYTRANPAPGDRSQEAAFDRQMQQWMDEYDAACRARFTGRGSAQGFTGNIFQFAGQEFFIDHDANYIIPEDSSRPRVASSDGRMYVLSLPQLPDPATDAQREAHQERDDLISTYAYNRSTTIAQLTNQVRTALEGRPLGPRAGALRGCGAARRSPAQSQHAREQPAAPARGPVATRIRPGADDRRQHVVGPPPRRPSTARRGAGGRADTKRRGHRPRDRHGLAALPPTAELDGRGRRPAVR